MADSLADEIQALAFDVFGTVVNWRASVEAELQREAERKTGADTADSVPDELRARVRRLTAEDWSRFATEWRACYGRFTSGFVPGVTEW